MRPRTLLTLAGALTAAVITLFGVSTGPAAANGDHCVAQAGGGNPCHTATPTPSKTSASPSPSKTSASPSPSKTTASPSPSKTSATPSPSKTTPAPPTTPAVSTSPVGLPVTGSPVSSTAMLGGGVAAVGAALVGGVALAARRRRVRFTAE